MIQHPSPNYNARKNGAKPSLIILHYTGMPSAQGALDRMCDPAAEVSAHYMIDKDGTLYQLVAEDKRAWHAGVSFWKGEADINSHSIGIELVNGGHEIGYEPFPAAQIDALMRLLPQIMQRHGIKPEGVIGHSDIAPERKLDPGPTFPWDKLKHAGLSQKGGADA